MRGEGQYLFDADGRRFLDAVNNVPHVGHSHPRVAAAAARQLSVLNTNTRYLHPALAEYVERLTALMPSPLSVCFIVNSGSEANELALRLARAYTGGRGDRRGGRGLPRQHQRARGHQPVQVRRAGRERLPRSRARGAMPDVYRARLAGLDLAPGSAGAELVAGRHFARSVAEAARDLQSSEHGLSAFICESLLSCGGQIVLPDGYLRAAYDAVHAAGGVCVADEVQVGFGRVGTHFWGFETQGVVPDIVTLGKPIGNGFPLGAVVTTPEIADAFDNGMEYFNTFGGSPVACAVGLAVLDVMRDEQLQAHALHVGARLRAGLETLRRFPIVGDVRGLGLFLGVELVRDRSTLEPAASRRPITSSTVYASAASCSAPTARLHNVIKIKPPMVFSEADADRLVATLADVLGEDGAQP